MRKKVRMKNIKLEIEYIGTNYNGWQRQPNKPSIQETIEDSIEKITGEKTVLLGSGRTDSGVHALGQVANFRTNSNLTPIQFRKALNSTLPEDISITKVLKVSSGFHSQYDSKSKTYLYKILNRSYPSAHLNNSTWQVQQPLNLNKMKEAAKFLIGTHDFKVFAHSGLTVKTTERKVIKANLKKKKDLIEFEIEANGFLKRMVRMIAGTLVNVGKEKIIPSDFKKILKTGKKNHFIRSAPAHGLFLKKVKYR